MQIKDIMTRNISCVSPWDTVESAARRMDEHNVGSVPVCENDRVVGILTDRDIVTRCVSQGKNTGSVPVGEVMTKNPITATVNMEVSEAVKIMSERQIRRLPVVENSSLVGMVALGDLAVEPGCREAAGNTLRNISDPAAPLM